MDQISEINWEHPALTGFRVTDERPKDEETSGAPKIEGPTIAEFYSVTDAVLPFFGLIGVPKGEKLSVPDPNLK